MALSDAGITGEPADPTAEPVLSREDLAFWDDNGYVIRSPPMPARQAKSFWPEPCPIRIMDCPAIPWWCTARV